MSAHPHWGTQPSKLRCRSWLCHPQLGRCPRVLSMTQVVTSVAPASWPGPSSPPAPHTPPGLTSSAQCSWPVYGSSPRAQPQFPCLRPFGPWRSLAAGGSGEQEEAVGPPGIAVPPRPTRGSPKPGRVLTPVCQPRGRGRGPRRPRVTRALWPLGQPEPGASVGQFPSYMVSWSDDSSSTTWPRPTPAPPCSRVPVVMTPDRPWSRRGHPGASLRPFQPAVGACPRVTV